MKKILLVLLIICPVYLFSQDQLRLDSLLVRFQYEEEDSVKVKALLDLSDYYRKNNLSKALDYSLEAIEIAFNTKDSLLIATTYYKKGSVYLMMGSYDKAQKDLLKALRIFEDINNKEFLFVSYHNLGALYDRLEDFDKALDYYFKALTIYNKSIEVGEPLKQTKIYVLFNSIANIYNNREENNIARQYYNKGLESAKAQNDNLELGVIYNNLGKLHLELKEFDKAFENIEKSLDVRRKINDKRGMAKSYYFLAACYKEIQEYGKALEFTRKSLAMGQEVGALLTQKVAYSFLNEIYEKKKNYKKALEAHKQYKDISDSLVNENTIRELTKAKMQFEFEKKEKIREAEKQKRELRYVLIISVMTLGFIIMTLLYRLSRNRSKRIDLVKRMLEQDLELRNKELTTNVMYLVKKNELMNDVTARLQKVKSGLQGVNKDTIHQVVLDLQSGVDKDVWEEFEIRFEQVYNDFYNILRGKFPEITPADEKLAAFLRLGMSTKEISAITHQSIKSIEVARTRLRKRLKLTNTEINLVTFLSQI